MADFDDFFNNEFGFNESDLEPELKQTKIDEAKLKILAQMNQYVKNTEEAVKFHEPQNEEANFLVLSRYVSQYIEIQRLENSDDMTEEEIIAAIEKIEFTVTDITFEKASNFGEENSDGLSVVTDYMKKIESSIDSDDSDDGTLDF